MARLWLALVVNVTLLVLARRVVVVARIMGESMQPTLLRGDCVLVFRVSPRGLRFGQLPQRTLIRLGAVVLVRPPSHMGHLVVKRIGGMPGDLRQWGWGPSATGPQTVPAGHVFLIGDAATPGDDEHPGDPTLGVNPPGSLRTPPADSRLYGPVSLTAVIGRAVLRVWPLARLGRIAVVGVPRQPAVRDRR